MPTASATASPPLSPVLPLRLDAACDAITAAGATLAPQLLRAAVQSGKRDLARGEFNAAHAWASADPSRSAALEPLTKLREVLP